ncbi:hypothetical protein [Nocardia asteroides]
MPAKKRKAIVELPPELYGNNVAAMFAAFGLDASPAGGESWEIRAATRPNGRHYDLIYSRTLAGPTRRNPQFEVVRTAVDELPPFTLSPSVKRQLAELKASTHQSGDPIDQLQSLAADLALAGVTECQGIVEQTFEYLGTWKETEADPPLFVNRSAHLITATNALYRRLRLPSIVLGIAQDPTIRSELQTGTPKMSESGIRFGTASPQTNSLALAGSFLAPLLGCLRPYVWSYSCSRPLSTVLFGFGRALPGGTRRAKGLAQLLPGSGRGIRAVTAPAITAGAAEGAVDWWVLRMNQLFVRLTDPATYIDSNGRYSAQEQLHWMLTFAQVLRITASIQEAAQYDPDAAQIMAFTLMGSFADRIFPPKKTTLLKLFRLSSATNHLEIAKKAMSPAAREILLPAAEQALNALREMQGGFRITSARGPSKIDLQMSDGTVEQLDRDEAVAQLLVVHRNATHGYGGLQKINAGQVTNRRELEIGERLLIHHNGDIPAGIAMLPYLYLLSTLAQPEATEKRIMEAVAQKR